MNYPLHRWIVWLMCVALFIRRVIHVQGFYLVAYTLGLYILNLLLGFLSPLVSFISLFIIRRKYMTMIQLSFQLAMQPSLGHLSVVFQNSSYGNDFIFISFCRKESLEAIVLSFFLTFIPLLDIPVFWPILVVYFMVYPFYHL